MDNRLKDFILNNQDLIQRDTKEDWEEIYRKVPIDIVGKFTELLLDADIDPAEILSYIPTNYLYKSNITNYKIPDSVISISNSSFRDCSSLISIVIPNSVTSIGSGAFSSCSSLTSIVIPDSVTSIGHNAFRGCSSLTSVEIPNSVTSIDWWEFSGCRSLTSVIIPDSVTSISNYAFQNCSNLTNITYLGTKKEAMKLGIGNKSNNKWRHGTPISKIICTDGEIEL